MGGWQGSLLGRGRVEKQDPTPFANRLSVGKHTHTFPGSYLQVQSESWGWVQVIKKTLVHVVVSLSGRV